MYGIYFWVSMVYIYVTKVLKIQLQNNFGYGKHSTHYRISQTGTIQNKYAVSLVF